LRRRCSDRHPHFRTSALQPATRPATIGVLLLRTRLLRRPRVLHLIIGVGSLRDGATPDKGTEPAPPSAAPPRRDSAVSRVNAWLVVLLPTMGVCELDTAHTLTHVHPASGRPCHYKSVVVECPAGPCEEKAATAPRQSFTLAKKTDQPKKTFTKEHLASRSSHCQRRLRTGVTGTVIVDHPADHIPHPNTKTRCRRTAESRRAPNPLRACTRISLTPHLRNMP